MKSAHRHELETNSLAHRLEVYIYRYRDHASKIVGVLIAIVALILIGSYLLGAADARKTGAWDNFNQAITASPPNLDELHRTAQEFPGTAMQQVADVTWADAQVYIATRTYLANRVKALEVLNAATSAYESVIQSSKDEQLTSRARLGLARIYEIQNKLDKAREEYGKVNGALATYAKSQVERLNKPDVTDTYSWLATAQLPLPKAPAGPGVPGQRPEFSAQDMGLPTAPAGPAAAPNAEKAKADNDEFDRFLKSLKEKSGKDAPDRYKDGEKPADGAAAPADPAAKDAPAAPPADAAKTDEKPAEKAADPAPAEKK